MAERNEEPRGTPSILAGAPPMKRRAEGTDQLESEVNQQHEPSSLDEDDLRAPHTRPLQQGRVEPEDRERTPEAEEGLADETGIEIDNAIERPREGDAGRRSS